MTYIVFLIDTSPSMNQKTYMGTTLLDVAKGSVDSFMKVRARDINSRGDRYMLLTLEESPCHIKAGFKENNTNVFLNELKNLKPTGLTMMGKALRQTFDILNLARTTSGIDTYGQGRSPNYLEPAVIITVTDGNRFTETGGIRDEMNVPGETIVPGAELTKEPFRWDQRLFALCLRIPSHQPINEQQMGIVANDTSLIDSMCDATGGRSYCVTSHRVLQQCIDSLASKIMPGVVIQFEKTGPDPPPVDAKSKALDIMTNDLQRPSTPTPTTLPGGVAAWHISRKMIYVQKSTQKGYSVGHWPIPENFWVDPTSTHLRPRPAHPVVKFTCDSCEPMVIENLPFDKYEMEPSPLTQYILERKQPHVCWKVFVENSSKYEGVQYPFGYLKASTKLDCVNLFIMPYDYPKLLPLLEELLKGLKGKPTIAWRQKFDAYVKSMPVYYGPAIKKAFMRMGIINVLPEGLDNCLNFQVLKYLKTLKTKGRDAHEGMKLALDKRDNTKQSIPVKPRSEVSLTQRADIAPLLNNLSASLVQHLKTELNEFRHFTIGITDHQVKAQLYRNPFDIAASKSLQQISKMRSNLFSSTSSAMRIQDEDELHSMPVGHMGNYQEYIKHLPQPLRDVEDKPVRQHTFGNPFKMSKNVVVIADEADVDPQLIKQQMQSARRVSRTHSLGGGTVGLPMWATGLATGTAGEQGKLRPRALKGPLPKDFSLGKYLEIRSRSSTPAATPTHEPDIPNSINNIISNSLEELESKLVAHKRIQDSEAEEQNHRLAESAENAAAFGEAAASAGLKKPGVVHRGSGMNHVMLDKGGGGTKRPANDQTVADVKRAKVEGVEVASSGATATHLTWQEMVDEHKRIKKLICKQIRNPSRNYEEIFKYLQLLRGSLETRTKFIKEIIVEAERFKRKSLINKLNSYRRQMYKWYQQNIKSQQQQQQQSSSSVSQSSSASSSSTSSRKRQKAANTAHEAPSNSLPVSRIGSSATASAFVSTKKERSSIPNQQPYSHSSRDTIPLVESSITNSSGESAAANKALIVQKRITASTSGGAATAHYNNTSGGMPPVPKHLKSGRVNTGAGAAAAAASGNVQPQLAFTSHVAARAVVKR